MAIGLVWLMAATVAGPWVHQSSGTQVGFRGVSAVDAKVVWASGQKGTFVRTTDGGATWSAGRVASAESLDFRDVQAFSADTAVLMSSGSGPESRVYRTSDGGANWSLALQNKDAQGFYDAIAFWDNERGLLLGDPVDGRFAIMRTEDGGITWTAVDAKAMPPARDKEGAFAASGTCLAVGANGRAWFGTGGANGGRVFRSSDWGRTWSVVDTPMRHDSASSGIFSIAFTDLLRGVAVGGDYQKAGEDRDNVIRSDDGGVTWRLLEGPRPGGYREAVAGVPGRASSLLTTGPGGTDISNDGGGSWHPFSSDGFHALSFSPSGEGWGVGAKGVIAKLPIPDVNAELKKIMDDDQADREDFNKHLGDKKWFEALPGRDAARLARVREMVAKGELHTAQDYSRAALVLQHGSKPEDFLLAHVLASAAVIEGDLDAKWLSAATLDRYLQNVSQPQIFGTQFRFENDQPWTMNPYNETLLPDSFRSVFGVPSLQEQKKQLEEIRREAKQKP